MSSIEEEAGNDLPVDLTIQALDNLLELTDHPQDFLHTLLLPPSSTNKEHLTQVGSLRLISKELFSRLEKLASLNEKIESKDTEDDEDEYSCPLSGIAELYTGDSSEEKDNDIDNNDDNNQFMVDAETLFNQVDIQSTALVTKVKKILRSLSKKIDKTGQDSVRLLNMEEMASEAEEEENDQNNVGNEAIDDEDDVTSSEDEETRRIRERMERSMAEMDGMSDEDDSEDDVEDENKEVSDASEIREEEVDPSREELFDGFFDLHEMEKFADEEEEMLPDDAFGEERQEDEPLEVRKKALPHLRGREGNEDSSDEEDDEFNQLEKRVEPSNVRRKRYRGDDDINALEGMYDNKEFSDDEDNDNDDVINMTAADFFGPPKKPSKEFLQYAKNANKTKNVSFEDDDSWNDHDFSADGDNWRDEELVGADEHDEINNSDDNAEDNGEDDFEKKTSQSTKKLSNYATKNTKLEKMTEELEKDLLAEKPWQMVGEAKGSQRPTNSLLEVTPTFEIATKMAPIITVEHTLSIEDMIKKRILAEDWDDVVPRELPDIGMSKRNGELPEVSQEKSKLSLGELYEREYLKKVTGYDKDAIEKETEEEKAKSEMKMLFANLCSKLDALSNYHFAPRPVADEAEVKSTATPAVAMEEILPLHVSDSQAVAPEEVYAKKKGREGILRGESEFDQVRY